MLHIKLRIFRIVARKAYVNLKSKWINNVLTIVQTLANPHIRKLLSEWKMAS